MMLERLKMRLCCRVAYPSSLVSDDKAHLDRTLIA